MKLSFLTTALLASLPVPSHAELRQARVLREYEPDECSVFFHDALEDSEFYSGTTWAYWAGSDIGGSLEGYYKEDFQSHRSGLSGFTFRVPDLETNKKYLVRLGFAEVYTPNCQVGKRIMDIQLNGQDFVTNLDVYERAGCESALVLETEYELLSDDGSLDILFETSIENPMVSIIEVKDLVCEGGTQSSALTLVKSSTPSSAPTLVKSSAPSIYTGPLNCAPTTGECASTAGELQSQLDSSNQHDTVSICDGTTIVTSEGAISVETDSLTLCCDGSNCGMESNGSDSNLVVTSASFKVKDITFRDGNSVKPGGNVAIDGAGNHRIENCNFIGGTSAKYGGNLAVSTYSPSSVKITNSSFDGGTAGGAGGGGASLFADNAAVEIVGSNFVNNLAAESQGGGLFLISRNIPALIQDCNFASNQAKFGGAFMATLGLLEVPSLSILNTVLDQNKAKVLGGAGVVGGYSEKIELSGNSGSGNKVLNADGCDGIFYGGACIDALDENYPIDNN